tara:strand:- start:524 stop:730 length:207 start_codon:yes stop_codon:yes gene_type:complete
MLEDSSWQTLGIRNYLEELILLQEDESYTWTDISDSKCGADTYLLDVLDQFLFRPASSTMMLLGTRKM